MPPSAARNKEPFGALRASKRHAMRPITARAAARLREERQRQGVSLESLASAARVSPNAIIRFETGKTSIQSAP